MSDLTAAEWAAEKLQRLHELEANCADTDLFCVGYVIPQVELIETENDDAIASQDIWDAHLVEFVASNIQKDSISSEDSARIRQIMEECK